MIPLAFSSAFPILELADFFSYEAAANHTINAVTIIETTAVMIYGSITGAPPLLNFHCISQITTIKFYTFWCKLSR
jgi:hypothetical protein